MTRRIHHLTRDDELLITAAKRERARLREQQKQIAKEINELSDKALAMKFDVSWHTIQAVQA